MQIKQPWPFYSNAKAVFLHSEKFPAASIVKGFTLTPFTEPARRRINSFELRV